MSNLDEQDMKNSRTAAATTNASNTKTIDKNAATIETDTWQLSALTEALGDLSLTVNDSLSVGRGSDNDVVLGSKQVSRNHALLSVLNGKLYLKDLNSSNGTFINEERIESNKSKHLKAADTVGFASFAFQVTTPISATVKSTATNIAAVDAPTNLEPSVQTDEPLTELDSSTIDIAPVDIAATDMESVTVADAEVIDTDIVDSEVINAEIVEVNVENPVIKSETSSDLSTHLSAGTDINAEPIIASPVEPVVVEATVLEGNVPVNTMDKQQPEDLAVDNKTVVPVQKQTIIAEVLSSTVSNPDAARADTPATNELASDESAPTTLAAAVEPTIASTSKPSTAAQQETVMSNDTSKDTLHKEPTVSPEQDKTTTTQLQEEADPDILRAKQAATAQFSGTANLGQGRDLGTEGNNAMDQAIDNPANAGQEDKKPSGAWFIWVFVAIIIVGLALWLFNMGGA